MEHVSINQPYPFWIKPVRNVPTVKVSLRNATHSCRGMDIDWDKIERENKEYKRRRAEREAKRKEQNNV